MPRKADTPKTGGRTAGTPNKVTAELRERIKTFLDGHFETIEADFKKLDPEKRITLFERYLKFVLPTLQSTDMSLNIDKMSDSQLDQVITHLLKNNTDVEEEK
jgi:hypothetical protein